MGASGATGETRGRGEVRPPMTLERAMQMVADTREAVRRERAKARQLACLVKDAINAAESDLAKSVIDASGDPKIILTREWCLAAREIVGNL